METKGLIIYGEPATGKSTLELNLRQYFLGNVLSQEDFACNDRICFLGKTVKRDGTLMSTGGAESMLEMPELPLVPWYVASIPTRGRRGLKLAWEFLRGRDELFAICLHTRNRLQYLDRRTQFFSKRHTKQHPGPARVRYPPNVPTNNCMIFLTEDLRAAFETSVRILSGDHPENFSVKMLEDFATPPQEKSEALYAQ